MSTVLVAHRHRCSEGAGLLQDPGKQHTDYWPGAVKKCEWALAVSLPKGDVGPAPVEDTVAAAAAEAAPVVLPVVELRLQPCKTEHY